jgi:hypothetical protein
MRMARHLQLASAPMIKVRTRRGTVLAVTRLRSENGIGRSTPIPAEPAFTVQLHLRPASPARFWSGGRPPLGSTYQEGSVTIWHLEDEPSASMGAG